jgi:hypothetical protein
MSDDDFDAMLPGAAFVRIPGVLGIARAGKVDIQRL